MWGQLLLTIPLQMFLKICLGSNDIVKIVRMITLEQSGPFGVPQTQKGLLEQGAGYLGDFCEGEGGFLWEYYGMIIVYLEGITDACSSYLAKTHPYLPLPMLMMTSCSLDQTGQHPSMIYPRYRPAPFCQAC